MNNLSLIFSELQIEWNFGSRTSSCYRRMTITARTGETETSNHNCQSDWCRTSPTGGADNTASDTKSETVECAMRQESEQFGGGGGGGQHGGRGGLTEQSVSERRSSEPAITPAPPDYRYAPPLLCPRRPKADQVEDSLLQQGGGRVSSNSLNDGQLVLGSQWEISRSNFQISTWHWKEVKRNTLQVISQLHWL